MSIKVCFYRVFLTHMSCLSGLAATLYVYLVIKHYKIINFKDIQILVPEFTLLPQLTVRERVICLFIILQIL